MAFRSPFQASKGGVPFPALSPFANSPASSPDHGSPMDTSPLHSRFKTLPKRGTGLRSATENKPSPMDAAPYTPVSARMSMKRMPAPDSASKLPGRLSFTPHITRPSSPAESASKQSPLLRKSRFKTVSSATPSSSATEAAKPPQLTSLYAEPAAQGPDNTITSDQLSSAQPQAEHVISISNTGAGALQHLQQALSDTLSQGSALSPGPMHKLSSTQSSGTASNAALVEPFQPGPQLDSNAMPITSPAATSRKVVLSEAEPVDPPTTDAASPDTEASARRAALQWKPMGRAANTPDKQDLGRRVFGGLPATPSSSSKKPDAKAPQPVSRKTLASQHSGLSRETSSHSTLNQASTAASNGTGHAEAISQLQQQAMQASTEAGVPVQEVSHQLRLSDRPDVGAESKRQAFSKLVQLQADAQQHAAKLKMRIEDSEQPTHSKAVARTEPQPLANLKHQQASNVAAASSSASTRSAAVKTKQIGQHSVDVDRQQNLVSLLSRLQLLQEAGSQFAQRLHLSA